ncbi:cation:proton antiporter [Virgisporangium aurantiacum]|uniref:cation:proton antiporter n=1 Tax=Virgisporangium aurantiacum TaxID=175570 RepID=UPI001EF23944|nr:cation:proton antiporter [Virgisporangium aurantiacum]
MASHQLLLLLLQLGLLLLLALVLGRLGILIGMPAVVGELCAGVLVGPSVLGNVAPAFAEWLLPKDGEQYHLLDAVGQLGVLLLVGLVGLNVDFALVRRRGLTAARVSAAGFVVPLGLGIATGYLLPDSFLPSTADRTVFALFLGVAMCVSAIPVIAKTLLDMNLLHRNVGQLILAAGMVDDVFGWLLLSVVASMATIGVHLGRVGLSVLYLVGVVLVALLVGRPLVRAVLRLSARSREPGPTVATAVVIVLLAAAATHALGMEAIFGAFVAGLLIGSSSAFDKERLAPLQSVVLSVLAPLFFATAGLRMDLTALAEPIVLGAAVVVLLVAIVGKFTGAFIGALASRLNRWEAVALGAGMNARGVVEVVVAMVGLRLGVLNTETYTMVVLVAIVTSVMAPPVLRLATRRIEEVAGSELRMATDDLAEGPAR